MARTGKDVFVHLKDCGGSTPNKGQMVTFLLDEASVSTSGKPQARNVRVPESPEAHAGNGARHQGTICQYTDATAWGFIACTELKSIYGKDVFFHLKDCHQMTPMLGMSASFLLDEESAASGKPRAYDVRSRQPQKGNGKGKGKGAGPAVAAGMNGSPDAWSNGQDSWQVAVPSAWSGNEAPPSGQQWASGSMQAPSSDERWLSGHVQSYSDQQGWGFLEAPALGMGGGKGIFFHVKDCVGMTSPPTKGMPVEFTVGLGPTGKQQAKQIHASGQYAAPQNTGSTAHNTFVPMAPPRGSPAQNTFAPMASTRGLSPAASAAGLTEEQYNAMAAANLKALGIVVTDLSAVKRPRLQ
jgi:cold shock CspA family protein